MKHLLTCWLLVGPALLLAQSTTQLKTPLVTAVAIRFNAGIGIGNKPNVLFGAPFALSGELSVLFQDQWRIAVEGGALDFRDAKYPTQPIGWSLLGGYSRYSHQYVGLLVGRSILNTVHSQKLTLSSGADYLLVVDPNVKSSSGFFSGTHYDYRYERYLNVPIQLDYSIAPFARKRTRVAVVGRWNYNAYHSFPMVSIGVDLPMYPLPGQ
ncbi:hypothetical protein FAES_2547 [Fibrella aestuarina BUZ 2]|uniref:Outer membrane protein beta-barrel domain-containing protein n=1 Tax=Fibrella aestuarina BUZ 2 TaxID=1166018 RepID=I0K8V3_9BACT|nr:hypothetical protein [Fibrella aestuarina]CCH00556.1 hypothetical protein FAES_2547 [Fibrella aestuarina BUZ 2]